MIECVESSQRLNAYSLCKGLQHIVDPRLAARVQGLEGLGGDVDIGISAFDSRVRISITERICGCEDRAADSCEI